MTLLHVGINVLYSLHVHEVWSFTPSAPRSLFHRRVSGNVSLLSGSDIGSNSVVAATTTTTTTTTDETNTETPSWAFKGHRVHTQIREPVTSSLSSPSRLLEVLLIHGFGCSTVYWRETIEALVERGHRVHALDLLGQGRSSKPGRADGVEYSIDLWADLVDSYVRDRVPLDCPVVLVGNSLGSVVAFSAATGDFRVDDQTTHLRDERDAAVAGICMFNCGVGLNSRGIANEPQWNPTQRWLISRLYDVLTWLVFENLPLLSYVLENVATRDTLRNTLRSLYVHDRDRVDEELVDSFYLPGQDEGAVEALSQIYCNDPGPTPYELHDRHGAFMKQSVPVHLVWGNEDVITPVDGGVGRFYASLAKEEDSNVSFHYVKGGHVPFDDNPSESNASLLEWLETRVVPASTGC